LLKTLAFGGTINGNEMRGSIELGAFG